MPAGPSRLVSPCTAACPPAWRSTSRRSGGRTVRQSAHSPESATANFGPPIERGGWMTCTGVSRLLVAVASTSKPNDAPHRADRETVVRPHGEESGTTKVALQLLLDSLPPRTRHLWDVRREALADDG